MDVEISISLTAASGALSTAEGMDNASQSMVGWGVGRKSIAFWVPCGVGTTPGCQG